VFLAMSGLETVALESLLHVSVSVIDEKRK
jgi:hypothetical protein